MTFHACARARFTSMALLLVLTACARSEQPAANPAALPAATPASGSAAADEWPSFEAPPADAAATAQAPLPRACALVTADQAQSTLGQPVAQMSDEPENCIWATQGHPARMTMLMVNLVRSDTAAQAGTLFDTMTGMSGGLTAMINEQAGKPVPTRKSGQELDGLGDAAWWSGGNADLVEQEQLVVLQGTLVLQLSVTLMNKGQATDHRAGLQAAARDALARIEAAR